MAEWKDTTGYSQGDKERVPKTWTLNAGGLKITVTCGHIYHKGEWVMHCEPWFNCYGLKMLENGNADEAKAAAIAKVKAKVAEIAEAAARL